MSAVRFRVLSGGNGSDAALRARETRASERVIRMLEKASAGAVGGLSGSWGSELSVLAQQAFIHELSNTGVFDAALPYMQPVPLQTRIALITLRAQGDPVSEGGLKSVGSLQLGNPELLERKIVAQILATNELWRLAGLQGGALLEQALRVAATGSTDAEFISVLTTGIVRIPSVGILEDMAAMAEEIPGGSASKYFVIVSPQTAKRICFSMDFTGGPRFPQMTPSGGTINGCVVQVSDEADNDTAVMYAADLLAGNAGRTVINGSSEANLTYDATTVNLFQSNMSASRIERSWGCQKLVSEAAAHRARVVAGDAKLGRVGGSGIPALSPARAGASLMAGCLQHDRQPA